MATNFSFHTIALLAFGLLLFAVQGNPGEVTCENLDHDTCAYAISSTGKRCVPEKNVRRTGEEAYTCTALEVEADRLRNWIETYQCIKVCGLDRKTRNLVRLAARRYLN